jgi:hypothetical protein
MEAEPSGGAWLYHVRDERHEAGGVKVVVRGGYRTSISVAPAGVIVARGGIRIDIVEGQ